MVCRLSRVAMVVHYEPSKILAIKTREEEIGTQPTHKKLWNSTKPIQLSNTVIHI